MAGDLPLDVPWLATRSDWVAHQIALLSEAMHVDAPGMGPVFSSRMIGLGIHEPLQGILRSVDGRIPFSW